MTLRRPLVLIAGRLKQLPSGDTIPSGALTEGTAEIDFGAYPGSNEATVTVTGQASILSTNFPRAFIAADSTSSDHTASDHRYAAMLVGITCGTPTDATGFPIYARSAEKLQGKFTLRWAY